MGEIDCGAIRAPWGDFWVAGACVGMLSVFIRATYVESRSNGQTHNNYRDSCRDTGCMAETGGLA